MTKKPAQPNDPNAPKDAESAPPERPASPGPADAEPPPELADERTYTEAEVRKLLADKEGELQDRILRLAAEYQNFRRRVEREKEQFTDEALERFAKDLIPVLDSFERALAVREQDPAAAASGLELVDRQMRAVLERHGVTRIDPTGGTFDPKYHEALFRTPSPDKPAGAILAVLEKGWTMKSRLLRPARVQVAATPEKS